MTDTSNTQIIQRAAALLNQHSMAVLNDGYVRFTPKCNGISEADKKTISEGLSELGMKPCRHTRFIALCPAAIEVLKPYGLDVSQAYDLKEAKWGDSIQRPLAKQAQQR